MIGDVVAPARPDDETGRWPHVVRTLVLAVGVALLVGGCAAGANPAVGVAADGDVAGFWLGLWHGIIAPITFLISLFTDSVSIYEVHNNGNWYDFGFVLGAGILFGGGAGGAKAGRRR